MQNIIADNNLILMEAAIVERLRRGGNHELHPTLVHAPFVYDEAGGTALREIYQGYIDIAREAQVPFLICTPTWRTNQDRVAESKCAQSINADTTRFIQDIRDSQRPGGEIIKIGGLIACKNDCYKPNEGLSAAKSEEFHSWQINQLAQADVDFLMAATFPNIEEAKGVAKAMEKTGKPYIISFVISRDGRVLDGTDLNTAVRTIDSVTSRKPLGFMVNCSYPTFLCAEKQPKELFERLMGYQANASSLDHCDLDGADQLETENVQEWGEEMLKLNRAHGVKILGGCCGTSDAHLRYIVGK